VAGRCRRRLSGHLLSGCGERNGADTGFSSLVGEASSNTILEERSSTLSMLLMALPEMAGEDAECRDSVSRFIDFVAC
jgi:hypothetical protein